MPPKVPFRPPSAWEELYQRLVAYRKHITAPVDTIGCHCLFDRNTSVQGRRFQILVALMLSSQTKDQVTAAAMEGLLAAGLNPAAIHKMPAAQLDSYIAKVGFHNTKTKHIKQVSDILLQQYDGKVPESYEELIALPGVGPKMAHLFLQAADHKVVGIGVDTHVHRIAQRFNWVPRTVKSPEDTRKCLESWLPRKHWREINVLLVGLGQTICTPLHPKCAECKLNDICPNAFVECKPPATPQKRGRSASLEDMEDCVAGKRASTRTTPTRKSKKAKK